MGNKLMAGVWRYIVGFPPFLWEKRIEKAVGRVKRSTAFMSPEHRLVHHFVVRELPRFGGPIPAELIATELSFSLERVTKLVQDLERRLTFLVTNSVGEVIWAYPVTVEKTPHAITFRTGERLYAA